MSWLVVLQRNRSSALFDKHLIRNTIIMITAGTLIIIVKEQRHWSSALFGKHTLLASSHSSLWSLSLSSSSSQWKSPSWPLSQYLFLVIPFPQIWHSPFNLLDVINFLHCIYWTLFCTKCAAGGDAQVCCSNNSRLINICALASISPLKSPLISRHCQNMNVITYKLNFTQKLFKFMPL